MMHPMPLTRETFLRRSALVVGTLLAIAFGAFTWLQALSLETAQLTTTLAAQRTDQAAASRARAARGSFDDATTLIATLPDEAALPQFYRSLEAMAARHGTTLQYNFGATAEQDPALRAAAAAPDAWVIPVDFLGTRSQLEAVFQALETGPYVLRIHRYRFDVTDPNASQLATVLILYGRLHLP